MLLVVFPVVRMSEIIKILEKLKDSLKGSQMGGQTYDQIFKVNTRRKPQLLNMYNLWSKWI